MNPIFAELPTTVFEVMSRLARETGAVNLGQGFPDDPGPEDVRRKAAEAVVEGWNQYPPMMGLPELRAAIAAHYAHWQGLGLGIEIEPLPVPVMRRDRRAQLRQPHHGRILVPALHDRLGGLAAHVLGAGIVGEALAEIDGPGLARQARHHFEDGGGKVGKDRVHGGKRPFPAL